VHHIWEGDIAERVVGEVGRAADFGEVGAAEADSWVFVVLLALRHFGVRSALMISLMKGWLQLVKAWVGLKIPENNQL